MIGFPDPDFHGEIIDELGGFISPLDLIDVGLVSAAEAAELHRMESAAVSS